MHDFVDAQQMHKDNPTTFDAPSQQELDDLKVEDTVKLSLNCERFWVEITAINGETLKGRIANDLVFDQPFKCDDIIKFRKNHIYNIYEDL